MRRSQNHPDVPQGHFESNSRRCLQPVILAAVAATALAVIDGTGEPLTPSQVSEMRALPCRSRLSAGCRQASVAVWPNPVPRRG